MAGHNLENRAVVQYFAKQGFRSTAINRATCLPLAFCKFWSKRENVDRTPGSGRPLKLNQRMLFDTKRKLTRKKPVSQRIAARELGISLTTINKGVKMLGLRPYLLRKQPALTEAQKKKRAFAKVNKHTDWSQAVFEDEKKFTIGITPNRKNRVVYATSRDKVPTIPTYKHHAKIQGVSASHVWPCLGKYDV